MTDAEYLAAIEAAAAPGVASLEGFSQAVIVDGGMLGASLAAALLEQGLATTLIEEDAGAVERALLALDRMIEQRVAAGEQTAAAAAQQRAASRVCSDPADVAGADLVIAPADALRAITAPARLRISLSDPAALPGLPDAARTVAMGLTAPVYATHIVELACGSASPDTVTAAQEVIGSLRLIEIRSDTWLAPLMLDAFRETADALLMEAATPWELDDAMTGFGFAMGVFEAQDHEGLDLAYARRRMAGPGPRSRRMLISDRMVQEGRLGRKVGVGWYRYPGGGGLVVDPLIEDMITEEAWFAKLERVTRSDAQMVERLVLAAINHAAGLLEAGVSLRADDLDILSVHVLGFPREKGGLLRYADHLGAAHVLDRLRALQPEDPTFWTPSARIARMAAIGGRFTPA